jgi:hypothetical protein
MAGGPLTYTSWSVQSPASTATSQTDPCRPLGDGQAARRTVSAVVRLLRL